MRRHLPMRSLICFCLSVSLSFGASVAINNEAVAANKFFVPPAGNPGDYNDNGTIDAPDYDIWKTNFGSTDNLAADGNANGTVDAADYTVWRDHLGDSAAPLGDWDNLDLWNPVGVPAPADVAYIHANRTANISSDVGSIRELRIGDTITPPGGTLNVNSGGQLTVTDLVMMGGSNVGYYKEGEINLNGGTLISDAPFFIAYEAEATETVSVGPDSLLDVNENLIGRFGIAILNQTGGLVDIQNNLIWGEGGDDGGFTNRAEYNLMAGEMVIGEALAIGCSPGEDRPDSNGRVNVSGGVVTAADLLFGQYPGEEAILSINAEGIVRINSANYSESDASFDIADGFIIGTQLDVTTVNIGGADYTQIVSLGPGMSACSVPEPAAFVTIVVGAIILAAFGRWNRSDY
jgi:hypothetical protein